MGVLKWIHNLKNIYLSKNVDEIYQDSFENAHNIEKIIVDNNNHIFSSKDGVLFKGSELYVYPQGKEDSTYFIPDFVKSFDSYSFWKAKNLKKKKILILM